MANKEEQQPRIKIFVSTHKPVSRFKSDILEMVEVGASSRQNHFPDMQRDDQGDNISELNHRYCELTAQYWVWKNVLDDLDYVGFQHYRRYFNFSRKIAKENLFGEVMETYINEYTAEKYGIIDSQIKETIAGWDIITAPFQDLRRNIHQYGNPLELFNAAPALHVSDLKKVYDILCQRHPDYKVDADRFLTGHTSAFCNMYIMRKEIFADYCEWLFPILEEFDRQADYTYYSVEALRTVGHLAERLFNIYFHHLTRNNQELQVKELQCVHFTNPDPLPTVTAWKTGEDAKKVIPLVLAADNNYVPMLFTTAFSALQNSDPKRFYDVTILHQDITPENQRLMQDGLAVFPHVNLRFIEVGNFLSGLYLQTNNEHISVETYYRFLIPELLPFYDKVLYLDADMIIRTDLAKLFDIELGANYLAAVKDIDFAGNLNVKRIHRKNYAKEILELENPYDYFQAGVLVFNTAQLRADFTLDFWLEQAGDDRYIYNDQDILNRFCQGKVVFLPEQWNVMNDCQERVERIFALAPAVQYQAYLAARKDPWIIHYAGQEKPWNFKDCDLASYYWQTARQTPFYEQLLFKVIPLLPTASVAVDRVKQYKKAVRTTADHILPDGSRPRFFAKQAYRDLKRRINKNDK